MNRKPLFILLIIVLIASVLRFYKLTDIPPSLEWDEVATGYDAHSILRTGRDQYGNFLPLTFRSLDDYKPPLYTYFTSVSIAIWGWNDWAVRFPAAFLGVLAVLTTYAMTQAMFKNRKTALLAALLLAISPWHVNFSRLALETNSTIFFTTAGVWAFYKGLQKGIFLPISAIFLGLNLYLYHNARVFIPLLGIVLIVLYWRKLLEQKKYVLVSAAITLIIIYPLFSILSSTEGLMRFQGTSIFTDAEPIPLSDAKKDYARWRLIDNETGLSLYGKLFHNQYVLYGLRVVKNYLSHFSPNFYFFTSDYPRHHVPEMGIVYLFEAFFLYSGIYYLIRKGSSKVAVILVSWFLFAPISAAVTRDVPHALRTEIFLPMLQISITFGILGILSGLKKHSNLQKLAIAIIIIGYFINVSFFLHKFLFHYARETSRYWQYGRREAALYVDNIKHQYDRVVVSTQLEQPHAFWLYYLKYDPNKYLEEGGTFSGGWAEERNRFDKYNFRNFSHDELDNDKVLYVGLPKNFPQQAATLKKIYYLNGEEAIWIVEGRQ